MVNIQLVTVEGCPGATCQTCAVADAALHRVLAVCGVAFPEHGEESRGEHHLADGRTIEAVHLDCSDEAARDLDPTQAPFLLIDGEVVLEGARLDPERLSEAVVNALFPHGLADLRP